MAVTENFYTGNGSTVLYSFTFPYLETTDIKVSVNGTNTNAYTLANATTVQFNTAPASSAAIRIYRQTDDTALPATFYPGSAIRSSDLNENFTQNLYATQETTNYAVRDIGNVTLAANYTFNGTVSGSTPTQNSHLATKQYVDGVALAGIADGDRGDITISSAGTVYSIDNGVVTEAKLSFTPLKSTDLGTTVQAFDSTILKSANIGVSVQGYDADTAKTDVAQTFTAAQRGAVSALTSAATVTPNFAVANNFSLTLGHSLTLANPTNLTAGQSGAIVITQGSGTAYTVAYGSYWKFPGGTAPTLTTTASAVDVIAYYVESATRITARLIADVK
jgi:hypothetical protein